jgi:hypothetical protein
LDNSTKAKILYEISRIDKLLDDSSPLIEMCKLKEPDYIEITAMAQILHSFYNGIESIIVLILKNINEKLPNDHKWHKTLLEISFGQNTRTFKIFRDEIKNILNDYLNFRHFIRHSYSSELKWKDMEQLTKKIEELWVIIKEDFSNFLNNIPENPGVA